MGHVFRLTREKAYTQDVNFPSAAERPIKAAIYASEVAVAERRVDFG